MPLIEWVLTLQATFQSKMNMLLLALAQGQKEALLGFLGFAFLYGIFHAAGPGHGKAVISSYLLATGEKLKYGLLLSLASAFLQGIIAVFCVGFIYGVLGIGGRSLMKALHGFELATACIMIVMGVMMIIRRVRHQQNCTHLPPAEQLRVQASWRENLALILSVGLRPCTGAVLILSFALTKGLWFYGIMAVFLVSLGSFIAVGLLATLAVYLKQLAVRFAAQGEAKHVQLILGVEIALGGFLILFGMLLFLGIIQGEAAGLIRRF